MTSRNPDSGPATSKDALLELFRLKSQEYAALLTHIIRSFAIFVAVVGAVFKFALDSSSTPTLRLALSIFGLVTCCIIWAAAFCAELYRRSLCDSIAYVRRELGVPEPKDDLAGAKYGLRLAAVVALAIGVVWIYLIVTA